MTTSSNFNPLVSTARPAQQRAAAGATELRVDDVSVHVAGGVPAARVVYAAVVLPHLFPADVVVEVMLEDERGQPIGPSPRRRMWSEQALDTDRFMFMARVTEQDLAPARRATVTVTRGGAAMRGRAPASAPAAPTASRTISLDS